MRRLAIVQGEDAIPTPFLVALVLWFAIIFAGLGLLTAKKKATVVAIFVVWALLSFFGAIPLIEEMNRPLVPSSISDSRCCR